MASTSASVDDPLLQCDFDNSDEQDIITFFETKLQLAIRDNEQAKKTLEEKREFRLKLATSLENSCLVASDENLELTSPFEISSFWQHIYNDKWVVGFKGVNVFRKKIELPHLIIPSSDSSSILYMQKIIVHNEERQILETVTEFQNIDGYIVAVLSVSQIIEREKYTIKPTLMFEVDHKKYQCECPEVEIEIRDTLTSKYVPNIKNAQEGNIMESIISILCSFERTEITFKIYGEDDVDVDLFKCRLIDCGLSHVAAILLPDYFWIQFQSIYLLHIVSCNEGLCKVNFYTRNDSDLFIFIHYLLKNIKMKMAVLST